MKPNILMRVGLTLVFSAMALLVIPSFAMAYDYLNAIPLTSNIGPSDYRIGEPSWNIGNIVKNYSDSMVNPTTGLTGYINTITRNCTSSWINAGCEIWHECIGGIQTRVCEIFNPCDGSLNKTAETRSCIIESVPVSPTNATTNGIQNQSTNVSTAQNLTINKSAHPVNDTINTTKGNLTGNKTEATSEVWNNTTGHGSSPAISINITVPAEQPRNESLTTNESRTSNRTSKAEQQTTAVPNITRVYDTIEANGTVVVPIEKPEIAMRQIAVEVINRATEVQITVAELKEKPAEVQTEVVVKPSQRVYSYIEVNHTNLSNENIRAAKITFDVPKSWIRQNRINATTVKLSRYESQWTELSTRIINETEDSIYYEAESHGLSIFAIVGEQMLQYIGRICVPLDRRCSGKALQECSMDGNAWKEVKDCESACRVDRCLNATEAKEGSQEERNLFSYVVIIIILLALIIVLGMIASHFRNKAKVLRMGREMIRYYGV